MPPDMDRAKGPLPSQIVEYHSDYNLVINRRCAGHFHYLKCAMHPYVYG